MGRTVYLFIIIVAAVAPKKRTGHGLAFRCLIRCVGVSLSAGDSIVFSYKALAYFLSTKVLSSIWFHGMRNSIRNFNNRSLTMARNLAIFGFTMFSDKAAQCRIALGCLACPTP